MQWVQGADRALTPFLPRRFWRKGARVGSSGQQDKGLPVGTQVVGD